MLGTGVFAVWTPALALSGSWLLLALGIAATCAALNAVSAVRLAGQHPESGGAYAYARIRLGRFPAVLAGWAFIIGKSASAAAAGLTIGVYLFPQQAQLVAWLAIAICLTLDLVGLRRSVAVSAVLVACVILVLIVICVGGLLTGFGVTIPAASDDGALNASSGSVLNLLAAAGLIFLAFAGYARITVLGDEVRQPARTIPRAVVLSLSLILVIYVGVAATLLAAERSGLRLGPAALENLLPQSVHWLVALGAVLAAGASLLSLIAGIGRTTFAMARRADAPSALAVVQGGVPRRAAVVAAALAALVVTGGSLPWAIGLSSTCVLTYYSVMHVTACTLPGRMILRWGVPIIGLILCVALVLALVLQLARPSI
jgi:APA family basic amino acid/polyamine antiporter